MTLPEGFTFMWLGNYPVTNIYVTSNGYINIDKYNNPSTVYRWDASAVPILASSTNMPAGISVAHEDLDPSRTTTANILTSFDEAAGSFTISYQNCTFWSPGTPPTLTGLMNTQAVLWADGTIDIRWGKPPALAVCTDSRLCRSVRAEHFVLNTETCFLTRRAS